MKPSSLALHLRLECLLKIAQFRLPFNFGDFVLLLAVMVRLRTVDDGNGCGGVGWGTCVSNVMLFGEQQVQAEMIQAEQRTC